MRLQAGGIREVEQDLEFGMRKSTKGSTERRDYLNLVGSAAQRSSVAVVENTCEAWFQMCGRMAWYGEHCERTQMFLSEIEKHAPRPRVKPSIGILEQAGGVLLETFRTHGKNKFLDVFHAEGVIRMLLLSEIDVPFVNEYDKTYGTMKTHELDSAVGQSSLSDRVGTDISAQGVPRLPSTKCTCGSFSNSGNRLVTGYEYSGVLLWDANHGYCVYKCIECNIRVTKFVV